MYHRRSNTFIKENIEKYDYERNLLGLDQGSIAIWNTANKMTALVSVLQHITILADALDSHDGNLRVIAQMDDIDEGKMSNHQI